MYRKVTILVVIVRDADVEISTSIAIRLVLLRKLIIL